MPEVLELLKWRGTRSFTEVCTVELNLELYAEFSGI